LSAVDYLYRRGNREVVVSNNETIRKIVNELFKEELVKCVTIEELKEVLGNFP